MFCAYVPLYIYEFFLPNHFEFHVNITHSSTTQLPTGIFIDAVSSYLLYISATEKLMDWVFNRHPQFHYLLSPPSMDENIEMQYWKTTANASASGPIRWSLSDANVRIDMIREFQYYLDK